MITLSFDITLTQGEFTLNVADAAPVEVLGVFGASGSGKTSLLESIAGIRTPERGVIRVGDRTLFSSAERINVPARDRHIGYVPQDSLLFPHLDVVGNVGYGAGGAGWAGGAGGAGFSALVEILDLEPLLKRRVTTLSGGEKQRVAIARALMTRPSVLLLDEPLAGVDRNRRDVILPYILKIRKELHVPLVYVTHDESELAAIADRVLTLNGGQAQSTISPAEAPTHRRPLL